jgi:hypothetical protein
VIAISIIVPTDIRTNNLKAVVLNKEEIDRYLDVAIDDAVSRLVEVGENNQIIVNKEEAIESFYSSLYASFGILSDKTKQQELALYIPVIVVTMEDGYYIYYSDEYKGKDGYSYMSRRWSEKLPYYDEDEDFIYGFTLGKKITLYDKFGKLASDQKVYQIDRKDLLDQYAYYFKSLDHFLQNDEIFEMVRKAKIASRIEQSMAFYTSHHNKLASQYGITYNFSLPTIKDEQWLPYLDKVGIFVVFQGYPYGTATGEVYNRFLSAGAKVAKDQCYYIEQAGWYLLYHKANCPKLNKEDLLFSDEEPHMTIRECVSEGAYACAECIENGIYPPKYP